MDGFYIAYLSGRGGTSIALFVVMKGKLIGVDVGGMKYDGELNELPNNGGFSASVVYVVPPGATLITGVAPPSEPMRVPMSFVLPRDFLTGSIVRIETPLGPVNARFEKMRDL